MNRAFVISPDFGGEPLADLKQWLSISSGTQDDVLKSMLRAAADMCENFTGRLPTRALCEEMLTPTTTWIRLGTQPIVTVTEIMTVGLSGNRVALDMGTFDIEIGADGTGAIKLQKMPEYNRIAVRYMAGVSDSWSRLDNALKQGIIRLAGHYYRERDEGSAKSPPASVAALWRPYRRMRLI